MSDVNPTTASRDSFGPVGAQPTFQEPSDYTVGQHVVFHHFDGKDYEAVVTAVWGPGSDVANRWVVHLDAGKLGDLKNIAEGTGLSGDNSFSGNPSTEGTFSLKPKADPETQDDKLVHNQRAGAVLPVRADLNPRPPASAEPLRPEDFDISSAPSDAPEEPVETSPEEEIHRTQEAMEEIEPEPGDEGLDTPANYITTNSDERGPLDPPEDVTKVGTTQSDDDEHVVTKAKSKSTKS